MKVWCKIEILPDLSKRQETSARAEKTCHTEMRVPEKMTVLMVEIEAEAANLVVHVAQNLISCKSMRKSAQIKEISAIQSISHIISHICYLFTYAEDLISHMCILTRAINIEI